MAFVQDLEFYKEMVILLSFDKDVPTDPSWFSLELPFTIKQAPCSVSLSLKSLVGLYQNPLALFLFSNSYVAEVSESSRLKEPWMSLLSKSKCTQFLYSSSTLISLLQPKMAALWGKWQGGKKKMQQTVSENQMENAFSFGMWSILHIHILLLLLSDFLTWRNLRWFFFLQRFCVFVFLNKSIWCGNIKHLAASMSYCWPYFFA